MGGLSRVDLEGKDCSKIKAMSEEQWLHDVSPDIIRVGDRFAIESQGGTPGYATALTSATVTTHPDGRRQCALMIEIPLDHRFANLIREET